MIAPLLLVVFLQATTSAFCYGYLFVKLTKSDRWLALALTIAGLALLTGWARVELSIFVVLAAVFAVRVVYLKRSSVHRQNGDHLSG